MPKTEIDYSNTIIYKITCIDTAVKDVYVGHTTNFVQRKHAHKQSCINSTCKVYEVIRANGGWKNWKMEIINFFDCKDHYEARKKEQEYFISLNATLNSIEPMPKPKVIEPVIEKKQKELFFCATCNVYCYGLDDHNKTNKHIKKSSDPEISDIKYRCDACNTITSNKKDYNKHLLTHKHIKNIKKEQQEIIQTFQKHECINCNKIYNSRSGLWRHIKTCNTTNDEINTIIEPPQKNIKQLTSLVMKLMKNNEKLTKEISEIRNIIIKKSTAINV
jgi:hypothetical protein